MSTRPSLKNVPLGTPRTLDEFVGGATAAQPALEPPPPPPPPPAPRPVEQIVADPLPRPGVRRHEPRVKVTFTLPANLHTQLKQLSIMTGERMEDIAAEGIRERIERLVDSMPEHKRVAFRGMTQD